MTSHQIINAIVHPLGTENTALAILIAFGCGAATAWLAIGLLYFCCWLLRPVWIVLTELWRWMKGNGGHF